MHRRLPRTNRRWAPGAAFAAAMLMILAGCSQSNAPTEYNTLTEANFDQGCASTGARAAYCTCSYQTLSGPDGIPFAEFATIDSDLAKNPGALPDDVKEKIKRCEDPTDSATTPNEVGTTVPSD